MKLLFSPTAAVMSIYFCLALADTVKPEKMEMAIPVRISQEDNPKIQAAILLDVSGSMDGLIEQAKAQLWNMVSVMGKVKCEKGLPQIEIALYEYGRTTNDAAAGYIRQISSFTSDLDQLSQELFKLRTNGGDEYCGHVILTSLTDLGWDSTGNNYKVIFIAGNEDFLQGNVAWTEACKVAKKKGVIVNTIYCGDKMQGIREHWNLTGECGNGSYTNIDHNARQETIPTPYDSALFLLNDKLNNTYLAYGQYGASSHALQGTVDGLNVGFSTEVQAKRIAVKGNKQLYNNSAWDLVDAVEKDSTILAKMDRKTLPDSLKKLSRENLQQLIDDKAKERSAIQAEIISVNQQRETFIAAERARAASVSNAPTLETEMERIIKEQVKRFNMYVQ